MKIQCAWCGRDLGEKAPLDDPSVISGMCRSCLRREAERLGLDPDKVGEALPEEKEPCESAALG